MITWRYYKRIKVKIWKRVIKSKIFNSLDERGEWKVEGIDLME